MHLPVGSKRLRESKSFFGTITDSADGANFQRQDGFTLEPDPDDVMKPTVDAPHLGLDLDLNDVEEFDSGFFVSKIQSSDGHLGSGSDQSKTQM